MLYKSMKLDLKAWLEDMNPVNGAPGTANPAQQNDPVITAATQAAQKAMQDAIQKKQDPVKAAQDAILKAKVPLNKMGQIMPQTSQNNSNPAMR